MSHTPRAEPVEQPADRRTARWARFCSWEARQRFLELPFPMAEYEQRLARTRALLRKQGLDSLLVCADLAHPGDVRWLTNYAPTIGNAFLFVPAQGQPVLLLHDEVMSYDLCHTFVRTIVPPRRGANSLQALCRDLLSLLHDHGVQGRLAVAGETGLPMPVYQGLLVAEPALEVLDVSSLLDGLRAVKSPLELDTLRESVRQADAAMSAVLALAAEGVSERALVGEAQRVLCHEGAEAPSFQPLAVAGPRSAWKHAVPTYRRLQRGEPLYIDLGSSHHGYLSDISRTVFLGPPSRDQAVALNFALAATQAVKEAARPGIPAGRLAQVGDEVAAQFGLQSSAWGTGHGLGLKLREEPLLDLSNPLLLQPGMVMAIEPMCVGELGTFVVEDDILITETGSEYLSHCSRRNWT